MTIRRKETPESALTVSRRSEFWDGRKLLFLQDYAERKNNDPDYHTLTPKRALKNMKNIGKHMQVGMLQSKYTRSSP